MPVYNAEPFLDDAILSVMEQSFGDWELICVNDGSTVKTFLRRSPVKRYDNAKLFFVLVRVSSRHFILTTV